MHDGFRRRFWIGVTIILLGIVGGIAAFSYFSGAIGAKADQISMAKMKTGSDANALANLASLEGDAPEAARYDAAIHQLIPDQSGLIGFNAWIGQVAAQYKVNASVSFRGDPVPPSGNAPGTAGFTLTAQGPEGSLIPFFDYLTTRATGFIVSFTSVDFTNDQSAESLTAQGITYFR